MAARRPTDDERRAALRMGLPTCRPPHGSLDDLLSGDAFVEELEARQRQIPWSDELALNAQRKPRP
jgi:hypothetical protein